MELAIPAVGYTAFIVWIAYSAKSGTIHAGSFGRFRRDTSPDHFAATLAMYMAAAALAPEAYVSLTRDYCWRVGWGDVAMIVTAACLFVFAVSRAIQVSRLRDCTPTRVARPYFRLAALAAFMVVGYALLPVFESALERSDPAWHNMILSRRAAYCGGPQVSPPSSTEPSPPSFVASYEPAAAPDLARGSLGDGRRFVLHADHTTLECDVTNERAANAPRWRWVEPAGDAPLTPERARAWAESCADMAHRGIEPPALPQAAPIAEAESARRMGLRWGAELDHLPASMRLKHLDEANAWAAAHLTPEAAIAFETGLALPRTSP